MFLPPLTTLVTRLMATTWSFNWKLPASSFFLIAVAIILELQTCFTRRIGQRFDAPVVEISATVKYHLLDSLFLGPLRDRLANLLRAGHVPARLLSRLLARGAGRSQSLARAVVNHLHINMVQ